MTEDGAEAVRVYRCASCGEDIHETPMKGRPGEIEVVILPASEMLCDGCSDD